MRFKKKTVPAEKRETHGAKWFECRQCGKRWRMWLEKGVEDKRFRRIYPEKHKPMPDTIKCHCGGSAEHVDWSKDLNLVKYRALLPNMNQFRYDDNEEFGIPILRKEVANDTRQ